MGRFDWSDPSISLPIAYQNRPGEVLNQILPFELILDIFSVKWKKVVDLYGLNGQIFSQEADLKKTRGILGLSYGLCVC